MSILELPASYFAITDPLRVLERWLNPCRFTRSVTINGRRVEVWWTGRAGLELQRRERPLVVELQLYFSCVVKKRVLFHDSTSLPTAAVVPNLRLAFNAVASAACDPAEFAASYPQGQCLSHGKAARMIPRRVELDYRRDNWEGAFFY
jgi:hypothetical protein